jgi:hypothetical protein
MPIHCKRCHEQFKSVEELDCHVLVPKAEVCQLRLGETTEGMTPDVEKLMRRRRRDTEGEYWEAIYKLLFPKDEAIPNPRKYFYQFRINNQKIEFRDREDSKQLAQ